MADVRGAVEAQRAAKRKDNSTAKAAGGARMLTSPHTASHTCVPHAHPHCASAF